MLVSLRTGVKVRGCTNPSPDPVGSLIAVGRVEKGLKGMLGGHWGCGTSALS